MNKVPKIAIVGRPNVGKSALFNRSIKKRLAIVDEAEGITRDRIYSNGEHFGRDFQIIDTGGIDFWSDSDFAEAIKRQAEVAIEEADSIIMVVDGQVGLTDLDSAVAQTLLETNKPVILAVNKVDDLCQEHFVHQFYGLGIPQVVGVSAAHNFQIVEMLDMALESLPIEVESEEESGTKIAIIGRANVGKSTLVNTLLDEDRCIVSPIAGTTRDSIDIPFLLNEKPYVLVDTAGIRRKHKEREVVEKFATIRTERALERADVCLLMLDAQKGMTHQDKRIIGMIEEAGKGCILLFNKWDLVKGFRMEHCLKSLRDEVSFLNYCPALCISAMTGRNLDKIFALVEEVQQERSKRVSTPDLNKLLEAAMNRTHPPMVRGKRLRVYYATQTETNPPKIVLFVNYPDLMTDPYKRYLYNQIRGAFGYRGTPLQIHLKGKKKEPVKAG